MTDRRLFLAQTGQLVTAALPVLWLPGPAKAASLARAVISVPGPGNLLFLPITLARHIGADQAEGLELDIRYSGGGPQSFRAMLDHNCDFAAGGLPALALQRLNGKPVVCIVPLTRVPAYTLLVRSALRQRVRKVADLHGLVVGVKGHVPGGRSTSQLFTEYILAQAGLGPEQVNYVAAGQSYESQHAALVSATVDALMADEPFATRLVRQKAAYVLADFHDLSTTRRQMGGLFLNGMVATREDMVARRPEVVERMVRAVQRTLVWIATHKAQEVVDALALTDAQERTALRDVLSQHKDIYTPDGRVSAEQLAAVERFVRATEKTPEAQALHLASLVDARWAGTAP